MKSPLRIFAGQRLTLLKLLRHKKFIFFIVANIFYYRPVYAVDEHQLEQGDTLNKLWAFIIQEGQRSEVQTFDGLKIDYYRYGDHCDGANVLIVPGWSEPYVKYAEVIFDLTQRHYCVYSFDHRGQGYRARTLANSQISYVEHFSDYVKDYGSVVQAITQTQQVSRVFVIAHSMGGLVALAHAAEHRERFGGIVLTGPMLQVNTGRWPYPMAYSIVSFMDWLGYGREYAIGQGDNQIKSFLQSDTTHSLNRFQMEQKLRQNQPQLLISGASNHWLKTTFDYTDAFKANWGNIRQNILLIQAGEEKFVSNAAEDEFCQVVSHCTLLRISNSRHELLMEKDEIRNKVFEAIYKFFEDNQR